MLDLKYMYNQDTPIVESLNCRRVHTFTVLPLVRLLPTYTAGNAYTAYHTHTHQELIESAEDETR